MTAKQQKNLADDAAREAMDMDLVSGPVPLWPEVEFSESDLERFVQSPVWNYLTRWARASRYGDFEIVKSFTGITDLDRAKALGRMDGIGTVLELESLIKTRMQVNALKKRQKEFDNA